MSSIGPELPPHLLAKRKRQADAAEAPTAEPASEKKRRVVGPAAPPAPIDELPTTAPDDDAEESSSDDDFGPALPTGDSAKVCLPRE